jgi:hypothetical protein
LYYDIHIDDKVCKASIILSFFQFHAIFNDTLLPAEPIFLNNEFQTPEYVIVLYGCETWSLTLREEHKLRVLRRIFGSKRDGVMGGWRKLYNERGAS